MRKMELPQGTQSAAKALALLRHVGTHHPDGVRLTDLISLTGQDRSTAHRLLACLLEHGYVERTAPAKSYRLGLASLEMGLASADMAPVVERFRPLMQRAARQSEDTVFLMVRSGDHSYCLHREEGGYPVKALLTGPGIRMLMGMSLSGVAMMAYLEDAEIEASYARHEEEYLRNGVPLFKLRNAIAKARACGFSQATDHRQEVTRGVGCAIRFSRNSLVGISIAAINSRMPRPRRLQLGEFLATELREFAWNPGADS